MKLIPNTVGGWMWWVEQYKIAHPDKLLTAADYKVMMQKYIKGEKPDV